MKQFLSTFDSYYTYIGKHFFFPMSLACALGICLIYGSAYCDPPWSFWLLIVGLLMGVPLWLWAFPIILLTLAIFPLACFMLACDMLFPYNKHQQTGDSDVKSAPDHRD